MVVGDGEIKYFTKIAHSLARKNIKPKNKHRHTRANKRNEKMKKWVREKGKRHNTTHVEGAGKREVWLSQKEGESEEDNM